MEGEKQPPTTQVALTFDTSPFHDGHKKSVLHLTVDKVGKGGVVVNVTCLLLKASSQLQQESFSKELFTKQFKPSHHNASVIAESESHFNEQSPMENLQTSLNTYAPTLLPNEIPVVFVNCSDTNLYLGTGEAGDVTSTAEWHKQPLPKLDKNTFVVATLRTSGEVLSFPSVRYESADRKCMFTTVADETGKITTMCSNKAKGEVAVSSVSVAEHNFYLIMMTVTAPTFNDDDLQKDDVKLALQEHGWYIL
ncbi:hypothetical protein ADEAN_000976200 [Angomonas deanei]|uniref:Uncharacterized protein n=1 Tax=Angomonas deanei TaxID=59799 RepID=A0A7G2CV89_9TRYP|nr:hypothetical protein ADEAN_000976200 [Angomonas deanei]